MRHCLLTRPAKAHALAATGVASHWPAACSASCGAVFYLPLRALLLNATNEALCPGDPLCAGLLMISSSILTAKIAALGDRSKYVLLGAAGCVSLVCYAKRASLVRLF